MVNRGTLSTLKSLRQRGGAIQIARVSDLLRCGMDAGRLAEEFVVLNQLVWNDLTEAQYIWTREMVESHFAVHPEGIFCAFEANRLMGTLTTTRMTEADMARRRSWLEKTDDGFLTGHRADGPVGFGVDLTVLPASPPALATSLVLSAVVVGMFGGSVKTGCLGARVPRYHRNRHLSIEEYVFGKRKSGKPLDPELYFYLRSGFTIHEIVPGYMHDPESLDYGVIVKWDNPIFRLTSRAPVVSTCIRKLGESLLLANARDIRPNWRSARAA